MGKSIVVFILGTLARTCFIAANSPESIEGVTFATHRRDIFIPLRRACSLLDIPIGLSKDGKLQVSGNRLNWNGPKLPTGERLIALKELPRLGADVRWDPQLLRAVISRKGKSFYVRKGRKRVIIEKSLQ